MYHKGIPFFCIHKRAQKLQPGLNPRTRLWGTRHCHLLTAPSCLLGQRTLQSRRSPRLSQGYRHRSECSQGHISKCCFSAIFAVHQAVPELSDTLDLLKHCCINFQVLPTLCNAHITPKSTQHKDLRRSEAPTEEIHFKAEAVTSLIGAEQLLSGNLRIYHQEKVMEILP